VATRPDTVEFILGKLCPAERFSVRAMFGEYALYADGKVVALVCDDQLYVKIVPASTSLAESCERASPYRGAKPHYLVEEWQLSSIDGLPALLLAVAEGLPNPKRKGR
jgi:DNA transformation protein